MSRRVSPCATRTRGDTFALPLTPSLSLSPIFVSLDREDPARILSRVRRPLQEGREVASLPSRGCTLENDVQDDRASFHRHKPFLLMLNAMI